MKIRYLAGIVALGLLAATSAQALAEEAAQPAAEPATAAPAAPGYGPFHPYGRGPWGVRPWGWEPGYMGADREAMRQWAEQQRERQAQMSEERREQMQTMRGAGPMGPHHRWRDAQWDAWQRWSNPHGAWIRDRSRWERARWEARMEARDRWRPRPTRFHRFRYGPGTMAAPAAAQPQEAEQPQEAVQPQEAEQPEG